MMLSNRVYALHDRLGEASIASYHEYTQFLSIHRTHIHIHMHIHDKSSHFLKLNSRFQAVIASFSGKHGVNETRNPGP
jgi:hypothetical protein